MENNLSITKKSNSILNITSESVKAQLDAIANFQCIIKSQFKDGFHYGIIPGTGKKATLLQPGAQVICTLLNLQAKYEIIDKTRDFTTGFFEYIVKCQLIDKEGVIHGESIASANSCEAKFQRSVKKDEDGKILGLGNMDNTVLKMAQKRALVASALFIGNLSDVFTQDFDDMDLKDLEGNVAGKNSVEKEQERIITKAQATRMYAMSKGNAEICKQIIAKYGYKTSSEVLVKDYEAICNEITKTVENNENGVISK